MDPALPAALLREAFTVLFETGIPFFGALFVVGIAVGVLQAATQINEMTLSFIPKLLVTVGVLMFGGPFIIKVLTDYTVRLYQSIPGLIG